MPPAALGPRELLPGALVDYFSSAKQSWLPARITRVDPETGAVEVDLRPGQWLGRAEQRQKLQKHLVPGKSQLEWVRALLGTDAYDVEMSEIFLRHATAPHGRGPVPYIPWSALSALAADLDVQLGWCGSIRVLEEEAAPQMRRCEPSDIEAFNFTTFGNVFWKLLNKTIRDHAQRLPTKRTSQRGDSHAGANLKVERELKSGTYGQVRLVREEGSGLKLAVKAVSKEILQGNEELLEMEVEHLCRVDHPNIVKLHRHYEDATHVYLVMDFCTGGDLQDRLERERRKVDRLSQELVVHIFRQVLWAVAHIHARGIIHLDIKALNIMLTHRSGSLPAGKNLEQPPATDHTWPHVMLIDLGLAQLFCPGNFKKGFPGGTPSTMAPEVWEGVVTPAADVFSCGVVFWELATLQLDPLSMAGALSGSLEDYIRQARRWWETGPRLRWESWGSMPEEARELCRAMLHKDRRQRPTAQACLGSAFLQPPRLSLSEPKVQQLMGHLADLPQRSILYKSTAMSIARKWPPNQMPTVQKTFHALDSGRAGSLGFEDVAGALREFGLGRKQAWDVAKAMDVNHDNAVDWTEFVAACVRLSDPIFEETLRSRFNKADTRRAGALTKRDMGEMLDHGADDLAIAEIFQKIARGSAELSWPVFRAHLQGQDEAAEMATLKIRKPDFAPPGGSRTPFELPLNLRTAMLSL